MVKKYLLLFLLIPAIAFAIELDVDGNGAVDINRGGTNAQTAAGIRANINVEDGAEANEPLVPQEAAEAGTSTTEYSWSPLRIAQAIAALAEPALSWLGLTDTPSSYSGKAGQYAKVNATETGLEFGTPDGTGDMTKAEYDTDAGTSGIVDQAAVITNQGDMATVDDAPSDGTGYVRKDGAWAAESGGGGTGTVDTSGSPVDNDVAVFTDSDTIEGLSESEFKTRFNLEIGVDVQAYSANMDTDSTDDLALGELSTNAYRGDRGKTAYDHSQTAHAPAGAEANVQADWEEADSGNDAYIANKPTIPTAPGDIGAEPADATILKDADIGSTVEAYRTQVAQFSFDPGAKYNSSAYVWIADLVASRFPYGIQITAWSVDCDVADPDVEMDLDLMWCDAVAGGAFPGANPTLIDVMDTTTGNSAETVNTNMAANGVVASTKSLYLYFGADPEGTCTQVHIVIEYEILTE